MTIIRTVNPTVMPAWERACGLCLARVGRLSAGQAAAGQARHRHRHQENGGVYTTQIRCHVCPPRSSAYRALLDAGAIAKWLVAVGMSSHVHEFHAREGGSFRVSLIL
jgi:hypothetical protein